MRPTRFAVPLAFAALLALASMPVDASTHNHIQPGDEVIFGNALCTLNFVFDGTGPLAGKVYIGSAAHCVNGNVGIKASTGGAANFGEVVYVGDYPDSVNGGDAVENGIDGTQLDFLLIEVYPAFVSRVDAEVLGRPGMPSGFTKAMETAFGDLVHASGYGTGFSLVRATRENRTGMLTFDSATDWEGEVPITPGDSGGPLLHETGKAMGVVSGFTLPVPIWYGPTVEGVLDEMHDLGWPIELRTA